MVIHPYIFFKKCSKYGGEGILTSILVFPALQASTGNLSE